MIALRHYQIDVLDRARGRLRSGLKRGIIQGQTGSGKTVVGAELCRSALAKGSRAELAVEMLTEVGVDVIVPWAAARSVVHWSPERADKGLARWRSAARESSKQARRVWLPDVRALSTTEQVCRLLAAAGTPVVLHESGRRSADEVSVSGVGDVVLVIGPEGGFSDEELASFESAGAVSMRLGDTVLRTSTAGVAGAAVLLSGTARWS